MTVHQRNSKLFYCFLYTRFVWRLRTMAEMLEMCLKYTPYSQNPSVCVELTHTHTCTSRSRTHTLVHTRCYSCQSNTSKHRNTSKMQQNGWREETPLWWQNKRTFFFFFFFVIRAEMFLILCSNDHSWHAQFISSLCSQMVLQDGVFQGFSSLKSLPNIVIHPWWPCLVSSSMD